MPCNPPETLLLKFAVWSSLYSSANTNNTQRNKERVKFVVQSLHLSTLQQCSHKQCLSGPICAHNILGTRKSKDSKTKIAFMPISDSLPQIYNCTRLQPAASLLPLTHWLALLAAMNCACCSFTATASCTMAALPACSSTWGTKGHMK